MVSHPTRVRGLKRQLRRQQLSVHHRSHPTRVRGLKPITGIQMGANVPSHPTRVRGLKQELLRHLHGEVVVAPHAGAWIETLSSRSACACSKSHPTRVRGLKHAPHGLYRQALPSHPTRVRGLKQITSGEMGGASASHPTRVRGLKHRRQGRDARLAQGRTPRGCVD